MKPARSRQLKKTPGKSRSGSLKEEPVEVYCRIKPIPSGCLSCLKVVSSTTVQLSSPEGLTGYRNGTHTKEIQYTFKQVFDESNSQKEVFDIVALPLVTQLISGRNGLLFTYGVTGSGKTYTMNGEMQDGGIMPRCLDVIFNTIADYQARKYIFRPDKMNGFEVQDEADAMLACQNDLLYFNKARAAKTPRRKEAFAESEGIHARVTDGAKVDSVDEDNMYAIFITYIEIYNNNVHDLLDDTTEDSISRKLQNKVIREDGTHNMYVHAVTEVEVKSPEEAFDIFYKGQRRKRMAHTNLNEESSRSHSIFTIRLVQAPTDMQGETVLQCKKLITISQLSLVDLAGSERTNRTKNTGQRLREAGNINNSLMSLRTCLEILRENQQNGTNKMVPYRDSKLTHLFKNYFDGEGQVRMIVCVNPKAEDCDETIHVLKFAEMTQEVQVTRPTPIKLDIGLTPGRRRANQFKKATVNTEVKELLLDPVTVFNMIPCFPSLLMVDPGDEDVLTRLESHLQQRISSRVNAIDDLGSSEQNLRKQLVQNETDMILMKQEVSGLKGILDQERKQNAAIGDRLGYSQTECSDLLKKVHDRDELIRILQHTIEEKDMVISQHAVDKVKVKEKCVSKIAATKEKLAREMKMKLIKERDDATEKTEPELRTPLSALNLQGTPYMPSLANTQGHSARRGVAVSNPRHRRSRSAGGGEVWLDHKPVTAVELNTLFQPSMKKRKSVTKLTDVKDLINSKTSKYCLTTQEQDTDGELETKLYKGDVIPTSGGGAQIILNDVELLKQISPTSQLSSRKRSFIEGSNNGRTESRCAVSIEGHSKRSKS